ncbi:amidase [Paeniglutamicibacter cryotolerans]|uniref:Asp-tRNA(Asn)/Glu-tRNA(Gln) amidotransferase A subunit family amidase n=1 Tax=Paeniglutamicibacter cryotolerans TaxID=670079 RepID=A0A839QL59_9MICC|nr:amidase [Paeniglutamicibacter cryotolerans]MBB2994756.1 Asp-tRNA(Asn)/Glu-tRNA(Gln) amidotransferase A subunit family amidase [Paeniglutamicibacter cryotolerans]
MRAVEAAAPVSLAASIQRLAAGVATPLDLVGESLARIEALEPELRAWVSVDADGALAAAHALADAPEGSRGPLWGTPAGVKDIIDVAGMRTGCGSAIFDHAAPATDDAACIAALRNAGGIVMGKTVTTEFAYFAPGPTSNPHRPAGGTEPHTPGGSSSGSAVAVASGMVPFAFGTQTAGSLTRPASYCGVAGLVAPIHAIPTDGVTGLSHSLDSIGFLAATAADLRIAYAAISGTPVPAPGPKRPPRLLVWDGSDIAGISDDMLAGLQRALATARMRGALLESLGSAAAVRDLVPLHKNIMGYEAARTHEWLCLRKDEVSEPLAELLSGGERLTDTDFHEAKAGLAAARKDVLNRLQHFDAIIAPAAPGAAPEGLAKTGDPILSRPWQALGLPTVTIPGLRDAAGMPLGIQVIGNPGHPGSLLDIAEWIEPSLDKS